MTIRPFRTALPEDNIRGGWANYLNGDTTPITIPADTPTKLTLDAEASGGSIIDTYLPNGVSNVWNSTTSQMNLTDLSIGDFVHVRVDGEVTTGSNDTTFLLQYVSRIGSATENTLIFSQTSLFFAGESFLSDFNGAPITNQDAIDYPGEFRLVVDKASTAYLTNIYVEIFRR